MKLNPRKQNSPKKSSRNGLMLAPCLSLAINPVSCSSSIMDSDSDSLSSSSSSSSSSPKEVRNWLELPSAVMSLLFTKVGTIEILLVVQNVCSTWRELCKDPEIFRSIDLCWNYDGRIATNEYAKLLKLGKEAVSRSCGKLDDFSVTEHLGGDEILEHIMAERCSLRRLRLVSCQDYISDNVIIDMAKKLPLLEELEIFHCFFNATEKVITTFGRSCPLLKSFRFNYRSISDLSSEVSSDHDQDALAIAQSMPELRHLDLSGVCLTDKVLRNILNGCPHLNFLDLSRCPCLNFAGSLVKMFMDRNIELRLSGKASLIRCIIEMKRQFSSLLQLQYEIPLYECPEAGLNEELNAASSSYIKALHQKLSKMQSQIHKLSRVQSQIFSVLKKHGI